MGQALLRLAAGATDLRVVAAVSRTVGQRVIDGIPQFAAERARGRPEFDVAIDFSLPEAFDGCWRCAWSMARALVSGTTGLGDAQQAAIDARGSRIPVFWASNFSLGVAVLADLVERAARALPDWDLRHRRGPPQSQARRTFGHGTQPGRRRRGAGRAAALCVDPGRRHRRRTHGAVHHAEASASN